MTLNNLFKILPAYLLCLPLCAVSQTFIPQWPELSREPLLGPQIRAAGSLQAAVVSPTDPNTILLGDNNGGISGNAGIFGNYINTAGLLSPAETLLSVLSGDVLKKALISASPVRNSIPIFITDNNAFTFSNVLGTHFSEVHYDRLFPDCCC